MPGVNRSSSWPLGRSAALTALLVTGPACSGPPPERITLRTGRSALVVVDDGDGWRRRSANGLGEIYLEARGVFRATVACSDADRHIRTLVATADDSRSWSIGCDVPAPGIAVSFELVSPADRVFVGTTQINAPTTIAASVPAGGTYDVVALTLGRAGPTTEPARVQLVRELVVDEPVRVSLDVANRGTPLVTPTIRVDGAAPDLVTIIGRTSRRTWFVLALDPPQIIPTELLFHGELQEAEVRRSDQPGWVRVPIDERPLELTVPTDQLNATLATDGDASGTLRWREQGSWEQLALRLCQGESGATACHTISAFPAAMAALAQDGEAWLEVPAPGVAGWPPPGNLEPTRPYQWTATWSRTRPAGGTEGVQATGLRP